MTDQTIAVSLGAVEYTWPLTITEATGKDISTDTVRLALGSYTAPGTWQTPDVDTPQTVKSQRVVQMLIGSTLKPAAGDYWLWFQITDTPEIAPRRESHIVIS